MQKRIVNILGVAAMATLTGCASTAYRVSEQILPQDAVPPAAVTPGLSTATVTVRAGAGAQALSGGIRSSAASALAANGFVVGSSSAPVAKVDVSTTLRTRDKLENWEVLEGGASVRVTAADGRSLGESAFSAVCKRTFDRAAGEKEVAQKLSEDLSAWLRNNLKPQNLGAVAYLKETPLTVSRIRFVADSSVEPEDELRAQRAFMDWIRSRPGVASAEIVNPTAVRDFTFKVAYDRSKFPNGLANTLVVDWNDGSFKVVRGN